LLEIELEEGVVADGLDHPADLASRDDLLNARHKAGPEHGTDGCAVETLSMTSQWSEVPDVSDRRRWGVLAILCLSVFLVVLDNTIINVALPTLVDELGATTSQLQWIVDAYTLVFAGLLLTAGSLGDRFGRKGFLTTGLLVFGAFSAIGAFTTSPNQLIAARGLMGVGAAVMFPATLAILVNVFQEPIERAKAIAIWSSVSGLSVALGPVTGGWLLEHFWWGSVLLVNVPIAVVTAVLVALFVPTSRDPHVLRFDPLGMLLSIAAIGILVWAIIEGPTHGWGSTQSVAAFGAGLVLLAIFVLWERHSDHPMLDVRFFAMPRFTAGSLSITISFFGLFGFIFLLTQYFQFVRGYSPLSAGVHTLPFAVFTGISAPSSAKLVTKVGTKIVVTTGMMSMAIGFVIAGVLPVDASYGVIIIAMALIAGGLGLVIAPATESIMGSLPPAKAGVGSAVNDTTREMGGALGVAVLGSLFASAYGSKLVDLVAGTPLPPDALAAAKESVGAAFAVTQQVTAQAGPEAGAALKTAVDTAFMDGFHLGSFVAAGLVTVGAVLAWLFLPAHAAPAWGDAHAGAAGDEADVDAALADETSRG
jgi:MFS transporter, DHA2 family, multidrug resistance protein